MGASRAAGTEMTTAEMLEGRHELYLEWCEPFRARGPEGNELDARIVLKATIHDCINMQRAAMKQNGFPTMGNDERFMLDFMAVHWATVVVSVPPR